MGVLQLTSVGAFLGMHAALDANPQDWHTRLVLADFYEKNGDEPTARAIRWQAKKKKVPYRDGLGMYGWFKEDSGLGTQQDCVPLLLFECIRGGTSDHPSLWIDWPTRREAEEALWRAWPIWAGLVSSVVPATPPHPAPR